VRITVNDFEKHWQPFTSNREFAENPRLIERADGVYYWSHRGTQILDGCSGLFCTPAGHNRPEIIDAVTAQLKTLDYAPHFHTGHTQSFEAADRIAKLMPGTLNRIFFGSSGSEAIDTAIKIVMAYHRANGEGHRQRFVSRERAYHGVNMGGTSLSGLPLNRKAFGAFMPGVVHLRHTWSADRRYDRGEPVDGVELAEDLQRFVNTYGGDTIAACFVEPIAGSTGVLVPPKGYLQRLREICDANGIILVFDEVICGFGRTGKAFGSQAFGVTPDIITMAKALTNGVQPMSAVAVREDIYTKVVNAAPDGIIELFHGYTYSAHPAACAAAVATLDIYERENLFDAAADLSDYFLDKIFELKGAPLITDIRGYGLLAGIDFEPLDGVPGRRGNQLQTALFNNGLHIKLTADSGIVAPPFIATREQIDEMCDIIRKTLQELVA